MQMLVWMVVVFAVIAVGLGGIQLLLEMIK